MRKTTTIRLLDELNAARGLKPHDVGYTYWADIKGDGNERYAAWEITRPGGAVRRSELNGGPWERCNKIRAAIKAATATKATKSPKI